MQNVGLGGLQAVQSRNLDFTISCVFFFMWSYNFCCIKVLGSDAEQHGKYGHQAYGTNKGSSSPPERQKGDLI